MNRLSRFIPFSDAHGNVSLRTMFSYIFDYFIIIALAIAYAALDKIVTPFAQRFSLNDITIQYPYAFKERIPIAEAVVISAGFPLVVIAIYTLVIDGLFSHSNQKGFKKYSFKQRLWELNCGILGLLLAQGVAFCITGSLKNLIGRPRPDLISRCLPADGSVDQRVFGLSSKEICTQEDKYIMQDAFRSFPSGHSSSSFAGLGYLSLYLSGKLHVLDQRGEVWRTFIVVVPLVAASCIAASRIMDYRHHPEDVLIGSALGLLCAWGAYRQYFPPLSHVWMKGRAYPMREWGVPMRKPDDPHGIGYSTGRDEASANLMSRHGAAEELPYHSKYGHRIQEEHPMYNLEPLRAPLREQQPSPGFERVSATQSPHDETDYEVIRSKAQVSIPRQGVTKQGTDSTTGAGSPNVFREQIDKNRSQRRPGTAFSDDEEDIGVGHRNLLVERK